MSRITILCLAITLSGITLDGRGAEKVVSTWPGFRGNGDSHTAASRLPVTWELRGRRAGSWTIRLPGYGQSSPVVWGEMVFVTAVSGDEKEHLHVLAISLQDGKTLWKKDFAATQRVPDGDAVSRGAPTPVVDAERLYAVFESGDAIALSHAGDVLWQRSFVKDYGDIKGPHGYSSSPVLAGDALVLQVAHAGPSYLLALDKATGQPFPKWIACGRSPKRGQRGCRGDTSRSPRSRNTCGPSIASIPRRGLRTT
ncbi:MAG: PQQ-binding-like beta-propeller repeat protein [Planctomycetaceae bacterium]|nr:PQQ-binding-like beta-propeller repeat protein [Planctomycetaceae bacterium]